MSTQAIGTGLNFGNQGIQQSSSLFGLNPQKQESTEPIKFDSQQKPPLFGKPAQQQPQQQPQPQQNGFPGLGPQSMFKFSSSSSQQPQQIPQQNKVEPDSKPKQPQQQLQQQPQAVKTAQSQISTDKLKSDPFNRIMAFDKEISELNENAEKLFKNEKDLKKCLPGFTVIGKTKQTQDTFHKLNEAIKVI